MSTIFLIKAIKKTHRQEEKYSLYLNLGRILGKLTTEQLRKVRKNYRAYSDSERILIIVKRNAPLFDQKRNAAILLSNIYKKRKEYDKVIENYYQFLKTKRDPLVERYFKESLATFVDDLEKNKDYDKIFKFWIAIKGRKSFLSGANLIRLGKILYDMNLYLNAEEVYLHLTKYSMFNTYWPDAKKQMTRIYFKTARYDQFLQAFPKLKTVNSEPEKTEFLYYRIVALKQLDKKRKS